MISTRIDLHPFEREYSEGLRAYSNPEMSLKEKISGRG
jgi:hypothetical protein